MSKLFELKDWMTINKAAEYLSSTLKEPVSEADIYDLVLKGHLKLSINFVDRVIGKTCVLLDADEEQMSDKILGLENGTLEKWADLCDAVPEAIDVYSSYWGERKFLDVQNRIVDVQGIWDLVVRAGGRSHIENKHHLAIGQPISMSDDRSGEIFVTRTNEVCLLVFANEDNERIPGSHAAGQALQRKIIAEQYDQVRADRVMGSFYKDRDDFLAMYSDDSASGGYCPLENIPENAFFVVRTTSIVEFLANIGGDGKKPPNKKLTPKERNTFLSLVAVLCKKAKINIEDRGVPGSIARLTEREGHKLSAETIRKILHEIKEL